MTIEDQIRDKKKKLQYGINREAAKISALSLGIIDTHEYVTGEEILKTKTKDQKTKTIKDQGEKQIKAINDNKNN